MRGDGVRVLRISLLFLLIPTVLSLGGCGYRLTSRPGPASPVFGKNIAVPVFVNKGYRVNLGAYLAGSLVEEFAMRSGGKVVGEDAAELILSGTVISYSSNAIAYSASDTVKEYRALITAEAILTEKITRKVVWKGTLSWSQNYPANPDVALQQNNEEAAIREICVKLAQQMYELVSADF